MDHVAVLSERSDEMHPKSEWKRGERERPSLFRVERMTADILQRLVHLVSLALRPSYHRPFLRLPSLCILL